MFVPIPDHNLDQEASECCPLCDYALDGDTCHNCDEWDEAEIESKEFDNQ